MVMTANDIPLNKLVADSPSGVNNALNYIKRFGSKNISESVYTAQAKKAVNFLKPEAIQLITESATDLFKNEKITTNTKPELFKPLNYSDKRDSITNERMRFTQIMASLSKLITDTKISSIQSNARDYALRLKATKEACDKLIELTEAYQHSWYANSSPADNWFDIMTHNIRYWDLIYYDWDLRRMAEREWDVPSFLRSLYEQYKAWQRDPVNVSAGVGDTSWKDAFDRIMNSPLFHSASSYVADLVSLYSEASLIIKDYVTTSFDLQEINKLAGDFNKFMSLSIDDASNVEWLAKKAEQAVDGMRHSLWRLKKGLLEASKRLAMLLVREDRKHEDKLTYVMALIAKLLGENSRDELESAAKIREKLSEAAARDATKKAKEFAAQERKAEHLQKTMGCVGKIIGAAITVVGVAAAAFTGGASLALAGVGLALAVGDEICQAATGHSFIQDTLQLVMKPLLNELSKAFSHILASMGVNGSSQELIANILGAVAASVIFIAGLVVAGSVVGKLGGAIFRTVGSKLAQQLAETELVAASERSVLQSACSTMNNVVKKVWGGIGKASGMNEEKLAQISTYSQMGMVASGTVNSGIQTGGDILASKMRLDAAKNNAKMQMDASIQDVLRTMLDNAIEAFRKQNLAVNSIIENMSSMAENLYQTDRYIVESMNSTFA
ncbi:type III secretion system translocon subunit SctE [Salmonella enterica]|nr:type III secretion system translocon subunit SctE [Salmonella enterica]